MAFKLDYSALNARTPAQREQDRAQAETDRAAKVAAEREAEVKTSLDVTLVRVIEMRSTMRGTLAVHLAFAEAGLTRTSMANWEPGSQAEEDAFLVNPTIAAFGDRGHGAGGTIPDGPRLRLHGRWTTHCWRSKSGTLTEASEFKTIRIDVLG